MYEIKSYELEITFDNGITERRKVYKSFCAGSKRRLDVLIDRDDYWELVQWGRILRIDKDTLLVTSANISYGKEHYEKTEIKVKFIDNELQFMRNKNNKNKTP